MNAVLGAAVTLGKDLPVEPPSEQQILDLLRNTAIVVFCTFCFALVVGYISYRIHMRRLDRSDLERQRQAGLVKPRRFRRSSTVSPGRRRRRTAQQKGRPPSESPEADSGKGSVSNKPGLTG